MDARIERFMAKVSPEPNSGCWLWTGHVDRGGYARFGWDGGPISGHRAGYMMLVGKIPEGKELDHLCRVRCCVNPDHLEPVTRAVNVKRGDAPAKSGARMRDKTCCPQGHPYAGDNLILLKSGPQAGARRCKTCHNLQLKAWRLRRLGREAA